MTVSKFLSAILIVALVWSAPLYSFPAPQYSQSAFSNGDLDQMLGPVALYPDPLLAQILPASSFGDQISEAAQLLGGQVDENLIQNQNWDVSVKAIAHYPEILDMMAQNPEWTAALGQAYVTQESAVGRSIQRLRREALNSGVLRSSPQQRIVVTSNIIRIVPAQTHVIYVPQYDPYAIWGYPDLFAAPVVPSGVIGFGTGLLIGSWLNRDWDWHGRGPYYHGWSGGGWVGASRPFVNTGNQSYVNNRFRNVDVNREVERRNTRDFRSRMERNAVTREKPGARPAPPPAGAKAPAAPAPAPPSRGKPAPSPVPAPVTKASPAPVAPIPPRAKPTPTPVPNAPIRPAAPVPQAKPAPAPVPAPKAPPVAAPAPQAKPTPAPEQKAPPPRPATPVPQAKPAPTPVPKAPPAAAPAPQAKPSPAPEPKAAAPAPNPNPHGGGHSEKSKK